MNCYKLYRFLLVTLFVIAMPLASKTSKKNVVIVGGGMIGAIEAYLGWTADAEQITIYEKNDNLEDTTVRNIVPSLTCDEILSVVPRGKELVRKMEIPFNLPGGIRVQDVGGIYGSLVTHNFVEEVQRYSADLDAHTQRTQDLLALGKMSMDFWQNLYAFGDAEFREILEDSNFRYCGEPTQNQRVLYDGYRIDLIYNVPDAAQRAHGMKVDYESLGYQNCALLTPEEVIDLDPFLSDFCSNHSKDNVWDNNTAALWRPGGCLDARIFLPKLYAYLEKRMGSYFDENGVEHKNFQIKFGKKVTGVVFSNDDDQLAIQGLQFEDGSTSYYPSHDCSYVFCPGEAVGTLKNLGFAEPAYAGFAGVSLLLDIEVPQEKMKQYKAFGHCMEVHQEGVVLAWQARFKDNKIFIGVAGTKAFYADQRPTIDQEFATNRNLLQLNMINDVLPEFISLALGRNTKGSVLTQDDLNYLVEHKIAKRWAGVRAVVYDGFPTLGALYKDDVKVANARCTTHLGSGGGSFAPAAVVMSAAAMESLSSLSEVFEPKKLQFVERLILQSSSKRTAQ